MLLFLSVSFPTWLGTHLSLLAICSTLAFVQADISNGATYADWVIAIGTLYGALATIAGFVIALVQLRQVRWEIVHDFDWRKRVITNDLAHSFGNEVAPLITYLLAVYRRSRAIVWIDLVPSKWMRFFDEQELEWINAQIKPCLPKDYQDLAKAIDLSLSEMDLQDWEICHGKLPDGVRRIISDHLEPCKKTDAYLEEFHEVQTETVNRLISFCNTIDFDLAIEDLAYPLVHDSFFIGVRICYCRIAKANVVGGHQHAYSVQRVFLEWQARPDTHVVSNLDRSMQAK